MSQIPCHQTLGIGGQGHLQKGHIVEVGQRRAERSSCDQKAAMFELAAHFSDSLRPLFQTLHEFLTCPCQLLRFRRELHERELDEIFIIIIMPDPGRPEKPRIHT